MNTIKDFIEQNKDYPNFSHIKQVELCLISDNDVPQGYGGINREGYSYGQLRRQPIINELLVGINNEKLTGFSKECNSRNSRSGFKMYKINGEYCFWGLRISPVVKAPDVNELRNILTQHNVTSEALNRKSVTADMIRKVTYDLLRKEVAKVCRMSVMEATLAIGNQLDCAPHEDPSGYIFMVPNWAHNWFRHDGYVSKMLKEVNI
ncbi:MULTISPECIES: hypothetical protein [Sphingobacterium]|uniref:Uncharacterized protein n=1 Tax=Sphingobacterium cellulitidis TaxID=1768011 RepID=A0A8H9FY51_9SPHI|nr:MULTISPECIES: hypothetical protein [Sphingobacterium]MBA8986809.1 hypothetical protein [Sphingobacterium soli]WFB64977.1 hypothetical protein PZ892_07125 [Sphingobacterium sp. WM]GGE14141.1 hypothetical protein GCM10011516_09910 [Sphingobacterium soli]